MTRSVKNVYNNHDFELFALTRSVKMFISEISEVISTI